MVVVWTSNILENNANSVTSPFTVAQHMQAIAGPIYKWYLQAERDGFTINNTTIGWLAIVSVPGKELLGCLNYLSQQCFYKLACLILNKAKRIKSVPRRYWKNIYLRIILAIMSGRSRAAAKNWTWNNREYIKLALVESLYLNEKILP